MNPQLTIQPAFYQRRIDINFERFHEERPEVYDEFKKVAIEILNSGEKHSSADHIMHIVRHYARIRRSPNENWKCNNNYTCLYARKLMSEDERFKDFFETRQRKSL